MAIVPRLPPTLDVLERSEGRPLTTAELAAIVGMSATFIRKEIKEGQVRAVRVGRGRKCVYRITISDAVQYARQLGLLKNGCQNKFPA
jgi:excisionase family DNA binding protein